MKEQAVKVLEYLNRVTGRHYRAVDATLKPILARFKEGYTMGDCMDVIDVKAAKWGKDDKMREFLRPMTLFAKTNFSNYIGEVEHADNK